ncbi:MAG: FAD-binding oxidoreductase [Holophagaceae bacterium]
MSEAWTQAWRRAEVRTQRAVARGTQLTEVALPDDLPFPFEPGHVVSLRAATPAGTVRHPYTVSGADPSTRRLAFVYRVIPGGRLTPTLSALAPGAELEVSGLHHQPIRREVDPTAEAFLGAATSSGLGPLWGYAAQALADGGPRPIHLVVGVREAADLPLVAELEALAARHPRFRWTPVVSRPDGTWKGRAGRIPGHLAELLPEPAATHLHVVGNLGLVRTLEAAWAAAGLPERRFSSEGFFNWNAEADPEAARHLAEGFLQRLAPDLSRQHR